MCDGFLDRLAYAALWIRFIAAEHGSMSMRILILVLSPALPMWIRDEIGTLEHRRKHVYQTKDERQVLHQMRQQVGSAGAS